ncbi:MAG: metallophosphoesterase [Candidatus Heimdallarchaeota archaeon]|nr:metallophosphoesterase [Candidatus Heimdallarchaeota archaeon]
MTDKSVESKLPIYERRQLLKLVEQVSKRFAGELRIHYSTEKALKLKRREKSIKFLRKKKSQRKLTKEYIKIQHLPSMLAQALSKGIPLKEPKRKEKSKPEIEQPIYESLNKETSKKTTYISELVLKNINYIPDKIYLQRLDADNSKVIVKLYVDWGYLDSNKLDFFIDAQNKEKSDNRIIVLNSKKEYLMTCSLKHISKYIEDDEGSARSLFIGQIIDLKPNNDYYYRLECYDKETTKLIAVTEFIKFKTSFNLNETNKPLYLSISSDLHGGKNGLFMRGKVVGKTIRGNFPLGKIFNKIAETESEVTFGEGYSLAIATGDLTENASYPEYWADLFKRCSVIWNHVPLLTCIGNHDYYCGGSGRGHITGGREEDCRYWHRFITNPNNSPGSLIGHWYSLDQGNVHLVFLDSNGTGWGKYKIDCGSEQWHWLENDLRNWRQRLSRGERAPQYCFVFLHSAILSLGFWGRGFHNGNDERVQTYLTPLFRKYGVDIAFCGHDHIYQRSKWLDTTFIENGRHGGSPRPYLYWKKRKIIYELQRIVENRKTRVYTTLYVPPNKNHWTKEEKKEFEKTRQKMKVELLNQPTTSNYYFGMRRINRQLGRLFDKNLTLKEKLIDEFILPKLEDHVWLRAYSVEDFAKPNTREIIDMVFIPSNSDFDYTSYVISCPEKLVG